MPYEVFSPFTRCAQIHGAHSNLEEASACHAEIASHINGDMPLWKSTGKYIHVIAAVDKSGIQRAFTKREKRQAKALVLSQEAILTEKETITTFSNIAKMYHEALKLIQISHISLEGAFDYENKEKHFWSTDAGIGQAFAYAQQAVFTLELSLKALLEVNGKLVRVSGKRRQDWETHDLLKLFQLLDGSEQQHLEQIWRSLSSSNCWSSNTFSDFLTSIKKSYIDWRYIPDLISTDLSIDISALSSASDIVLDVVTSSFRESSPIKFDITSRIYPVCENLDTIRIPKRVIVEGQVCSVKIPDGFDPDSIVEVVIQSEFYFKDYIMADFHQDVTARFKKSQVESYYGIEGEKVALTGWSTDAEPHTLDSASHREVLKRRPLYELKPRTLRGLVYNLTRSIDKYGQLLKVNLMLDDYTYYTVVDCLFITEGEREKVAKLQLGDEITISGQATLLNGRPITLVGPSLVEKC